MIEERLKRIDEIKDQINTNNSKREEKAASLGRIAWQQKEKAGDTEPYEPVFRDIQRLEQESAGYSDMIRQIRDTVAKKKELENLLAALKEEMKSVEGEFQDTYEGIGRAAYGAYEDGSLKKAGFADLFAEITSAERSLQSIREELEKPAGVVEQENLLKKIADKSKTALVKTRERSAENKLKRLYQKAGKAFCSSDILKDLEDSSLQQIFEPFRTELEGLEKLKTREQELVAEEEQVDRDLSHLGVSRVGKKRIGELEQSIEKCRLSLDKLHRDAGNLLLEKECPGYKDVEEVQDVFNEIRELDETNTALEETLGVLETTLQIDGLKSRIQEKDEEIHRAKEKIDRLNGEIKEQQKQKKQLQAEVRQLEKTIEPEEEA